MHLAQAALRRLTTLILASALVSGLVGVARADRFPLVGLNSAPRQGTSSVNPVGGQIVSVDPSLVPCSRVVTFDDLKGGDTPGTNYDGVVVSGGLLFAERFVGQTQGASGDFDAIAGTPSSPLMPQAGDAGENLDVFDYSGNVLVGLGPIGFPDIDAIGEGAIAIFFPLPQSKVKLDLVGGNGGSATLSFYRPNGTLIDNVTVTDLGDLPYGFATSDASASIAGILIQNSDASGIGVVNICYDTSVTNTRIASWGSLKQLYR
jgi:hypothetical protein